jgi:hypothetical protein
MVIAVPFSPASPLLAAVPTYASYRFNPGFVENKTLNKKQNPEIVDNSTHVNPAQPISQHPQTTPTHRPITTK